MFTFSFDCHSSFCSVVYTKVIRGKQNKLELLQATTQDFIAPPHSLNNVVTPVRVVQKLVDHDFEKWAEVAADLQMVCQDSEIGPALFGNALGLMKSENIDTMLEKLMEDLTKKVTTADIMKLHELVQE